MPTTISKRYTNFGFGNRSDFTNLNNFKKTKKMIKTNLKKLKENLINNDKPVLNGPAYTISNC